MANAKTLCTYISKVVDGANLNYDEAIDAMDIMMSGEATDAQLGSFLTALRMKGETPEEISGFARGMRDKAATVKNHRDSIEIVGTGGDLSNSFNISSTSFFVIAAAGVKAAKHGNRSVSSKSGAADVLEALGIRIQSTPEKAAEALDNIGLTFLFAQSFHTSMKYVGPTRKQLGIRTVFNILGPLANPAETDYTVLGSYSKELLPVFAKVLIKLGIKHAMIVHGNDGLDEISVSDYTDVVEVIDDEIKEYTIKPEDFGIERSKKEEIVGGTAVENAEITKGILKGEIKGAKRNIVLMNAGCALYTIGKANTIAEGIKIAEEMIDSGKAYEKLQQYIEFSNR